MVTSRPQQILITGVSSGLGHGLAAHYLNVGAKVGGLSRRRAPDLEEHAGFHYVEADLRDSQQVTQAAKFFRKHFDHLDLVILNAGVLGQFGDLVEAQAEDLKNTMDVNVWANVQITNALFEQGFAIDQLVAISSGASIHGNRGWSGYSISKAALNMWIKLLAKEHVDTHCSALAPGLVDTAMQDVLCGKEPDARFPSLEKLRSSRHTERMPDPNQAAERLSRAIAVLPDRIDSGEFIDARKMDLP